MITTEARTGHGRLRGALVDGVHSFKGIPYAEPPFAANRLRPPRPVAPWTGVREALDFGAEPPQPRLPPDDPTAAMVWDPAEPGEDCLNLNVWTPDPGASGLPVMVWIPGGMFEVCSGATYDGSRFARDGVVCVTINYRVGPEGFLFLADGAANLGLLDQVAALKWVRENIAAFGGDPATVTIFGESAGAMSVGTLLAMPRAEGLFRRAICQSGAADRVIAAETALRIGRELAERLGVEASREAIAAVLPDRLLGAAAELKADLFAHPDPARWGLEVVASALPWQPVVDGDVIPAHPIERIAAGAGAGVDVMAGSNLDDWGLFVIANGLGQIGDEVLAGAVADHGFATAAAYGVSGERLAAYRAAYPAARPGELLAAIQTDWWCRIPALRLAEAHVPAAAATHMYEFAWRSPALSGAFGACHALEIGFVFDTLDLGPRQMLGPLLAGASQALAAEMHRAWVAFATSGDPGWPCYDLGRRATMRFDTVSGVVDDPRAAERAIWAGAM
ncbi:MAG: carboxylesterase/lipase family protein [Chloroflexi bacterium]|jgi:para-nitrobenzyl esterase|nr:carboxylesterase/lipase family protein [Chloroflexota bacterium]